MINIVLSGVGGQGIALAAKALAVAAAVRGWPVVTSEQRGIEQRGGSIVTHVRIANRSENIYSPLVTRGTADLVIAFEPGEAARTLPYLAPAGTLIMATTPIIPVSATLHMDDYNVADIIENIQLALYNSMIRNMSSKGEQPAAVQARLVPVDDLAITNMLGANRKLLSSIMLAWAVREGCLPLSVEELCRAIASCVKSEFIDVNIEAVETALTFQPQRS